MNKVSDERERAYRADQEATKERIWWEEHDHPRGQIEWTQHRMEILLEFLEMNESSLAAFREAYSKCALHITPCSPTLIKEVAVPTLNSYKVTARGQRNLVFLALEVFLKDSYGD